MPYYPKNKIITNLYTSSDNVVQVSTLEPYVGPYYKLSNGKTYKGATPQSFRYPEEIIDLNSLSRKPNSPVTNKIATPSTTSILNSDIIGNYIEVLEDKPVSRFLPTPYYPTPSPTDYKRGYFTRYFAKQVNDYSFIEINDKTYKNLSQNNSEYLWELYYVTKIPWQISGDVNKVYNTNKNIVEIQEKNKFRGLSTFLRKNYLKFYLDKDGRKVGYVNEK